MPFNRFFQPCTPRNTEVRKPAASSPSTVKVDQHCDRARSPKTFLAFSKLMANHLRSQFMQCRVGPVSLRNSLSVNEDPSSLYATTTS